MNSELLSSQLQELKAMIESRIAYDETKEEAFQRLYREFDELKQTSLNESVRPFLFDLMLLHDRVSKRLSDGGAPEELSDCESFVSSILEEVEEVLSRQGIERVPRVDSEFEPRTQKIIGSVESETQAKDGHVVEVVRNGFVAHGKVIRPQEVIVARFDAKKK